MQVNIQIIRKESRITRTSMNWARVKWLKLYFQELKSSTWNWQKELLSVLDNTHSMYKLLLFLLSLPIFVAAQNTTIPRDTSFTVISTFLKEQKDFPFIQIANPAVPASIST